MNLNLGVKEPMEPRIVGEPCPVCKQKVETYDDLPGELFCSDFCARATEEEQEAFLKMQEGDFGLWPCAESGCVVEDMYTPGGICSGCAPKAEARRKKALLREAEKELARIQSYLGDLSSMLISVGDEKEPFKKFRDLLDKARGVKRDEEGRPKSTTLYEVRERIKDELGLIPSNYAEAVKLLDDMLVQEDRDYIQKAKNADEIVLQLRHSFGMYLRNEWRLWHGSKMAKFLETQGFTHPDDMSTAILRYYAKAKIASRYERLDDDDNFVDPGV